MQVLIDSIKPDPKQPRKVFSKDHINGLATSLAMEGMINPIEVDSAMMIITGECRWRAAQQLGWMEVPVSINQSNFTEYERLRHQMAENVHQSGSTYDTMMNPIDTAKGYAKLIQLKLAKDIEPGSESWFKETYGSGITKRLAEEIGIDQKTIEEHLRLLEEPEFVQTDIQEGRPRTYYREANQAPEAVKDQIKERIAGGEYKTREEVVQDVAVAKHLPDLAEASLARQRDRESTATNRVLNNIAKLGLALESMPLSQADIREKGLISQQLQWLVGKIEEYLS